MRKTSVSITSYVTIASFVACLSITALWIRSHLIVDALAKWGSISLFAYSMEGRLSLRVVQSGPEGVPPEQPGWNYHTFSWEGPLGEVSDEGADVSWNFAGFHWSHGQPAEQKTGAVWVAAPFWHLGLPHWFPALLFALLPARWMIRHERQRRRREQGCCEECGYDLRSSSGRCPECGHSASPTNPLS